MRALAAAVLAMGVAVSTSAPAKDPAVGHPRTPEPDLLEPPIRQLYPSRDMEWLVRIITRNEWADGPHTSLGLGTDLSYAWDYAQRFRTGAYLEGLGGRWADGERGKIALGLGVVQRMSFAMDDLFDGYVVVRVGGILGVAGDDDPEWGVRGGAGLGARVARFAFLELTYDRVWVFGDPIVQNDFGEESRHTGGIAIGGGADLCMFIGGCAREEPDPEPEDRTEELYTEAENVCETKHEKEALCNAVDLAMDAHRYHAVAGEDGIHAFLTGVHKEVANNNVRNQIELLIHTHDRLCRKRDDSKAWGRWAAQNDRELAHPISYAPVAVELRRALGCDGLVTDK